MPAKAGGYTTKSIKLAYKIINTHAKADGYAAKMIKLKNLPDTLTLEEVEALRLKHVKYNGL